MGLPDALRIVISAVLIAPMAFFMGIPFPLGLARVEASDARLIPWAWAINGCALGDGSGAGHPARDPSRIHRRGRGGADAVWGYSRGSALNTVASQGCCSNGRPDGR